MIAYEGYFGFTVSTLICIYKVAETIPIFSYSLDALYGYKWIYLATKMAALNNEKDMYEQNSNQSKVGFGSLFLFAMLCGILCLAPVGTL